MTIEPYFFVVAIKQEDGLKCPRDVVQHDGLCIPWAAEDLCSFLRADRLCGYSRATDRENPVFRWMEYLSNPDKDFTQNSCENVELRIAPDRLPDSEIKIVFRFITTEVSQER